MNIKILFNFGEDINKLNGENNEETLGFLIDYGLIKNEKIKFFHKLQREEKAVKLFKDLPKELLKSSFIKLHYIEKYKNKSSSYEEKLFSNNVDKRIDCANNGYGLNILVNDENQHVRKAVAKQGYRMDLLIKDNSPHVRKEVALNGYRLDILISDCSFMVRDAVMNDYDVKRNFLPLLKKSVDINTKNYDSISSNFEEYNLTIDGISDNTQLYLDHKANYLKLI